MGNDEATNNFNCKKCTSEDTERMVACDTCNEWFHFECVNVNSDIANVSWHCDGCGQKEALENYESSKTSDPSNTSPKQQGNQQQAITTGTSKIATLATSTPATITSSYVMDASAYTKAPITSSNLALQGNFSSVESSTFAGVTSQTRNSNDLIKLRDLKLKMLEEERTMQQNYLDRKYKILSETQGINCTGNDFTLNSFSNQPTSLQLAARQVIPKDLPPFDGNPEDWPLFISSYKHSTDAAGYSDVENLIRLQSCLRGRAKDLVRNKLLLPSMVNEIIQTLEMCYGRPEHILESMIEKIRRFPPPKERLDNFIEFSLLVKNICSTMEACSMYSHLNNPMLVKELVDKLPNSQKLNWAMCTKDSKIPIIKVFSDWIYNIGMAATQVVSPTIKRSVSINTHSAAANQTRKSCVVCNNDTHKIQDCDEFKNATLDRKWNIVNNKKLCRQCLNTHRRKCYINKTCGINSCTAKHHQLLHNYTEARSETSVGDSHTNVYSNAVNAHQNIKGNTKPLFRFIPVCLYSSSKTIETFAFLDEGSSVTLMDEDIFRSLNIDGKNEPLTLKWTGHTTREEEGSIKLSVKISGTENKTRKFILNDVHTVRHLGLPMQSMNFDELVNENAFLNGLPIKSYKDIMPKILIGVNNWKLAVPLKIREGRWNQPIASKTRLGWTIQGPSVPNSTMGSVNLHTCDCEQKYLDLHEQIKNYFSLEESPKSNLLSSNDQMALKTLEDTCKKKEGQYEIGLLWKSETPVLPDSYDAAMNRLKCLQNKFKKDKDLKNAMQKEIDKLIVKGYAMKLTAAETQSCSNPIWYLPTFIALNPNKPGKVRLVWDGASKAGGVSLNDCLMTGPDLLRPLFDVLIEFRVGKIAICGDISEMFHRINVRKEDMHVQRFLWLDDEENEIPSVYVMRALTFGISCAPCIAHFVRNKNADTFKSDFPRAVKAIQFNHYMDDFIDSVDTEDEAIQLAREVKNIHGAAGFQMHNWATNSERLRNYMSEEIQGEQFSHNLGSIEKILGMYWDPNNDNLRYLCRFAKLRRDVLDERVTPTKRELLQVLMAIFDPLGFLSIYTVELKILLQQVWRSKINWDDELSTDMATKWCQWKSALSDISNVSIPRCYSFNLNKASNIELHTFVDAGEYAYAAICYLRVHCNTDINISIVAAKSKVAPLKPVSIPRMELQAAVMGVKLASKIKSCSRLKISKFYWWTDSKTVLNWLSMDPRNFKPFVMHRVSEILETTQLNQWMWVPSKNNPADAATKISSPNASQWFQGPEFLRFSQDEWPKCSSLNLQYDNTEIRHSVFHIQKHIQPINYSYFSNWKRLYRAVATFTLYIERLKALTKKSLPPMEVTFAMIHKSKTLLFKSAQLSEFQEDIASLKHKKNVGPKSVLKQLNPYLDDDGVIRSEGRAKSLSCNRPIILPKDHHITFLIVRYHHEEYHHCFHEAVINIIRSKYYIPCLRVIYKTVRRQCQRCKNNSSTPQIPQMGSLPLCRLASMERPFTFVGIDFFGPYNVIVGRHKEKRWGVVFTCLTLRAIHIEVAHSLDTSSCVMCIANFISRRGMPREIFTDNGTNFKATARILREEQQNLNLKNICKKFDEIKWTFNPPAAPHMGGAWERMVKSIKLVLKNAFPIFNFNDESFRSALCEAEFIINSRPLTFVSLDAADDEPLTPNQLLLGSSSGFKPICSNNDLRDRWRQTQKFADYFWQRWVKEYAPNLIRRCKWYNKQPPVSVGDVVILIDETLPRNTWLKGIIVEVTTAKDGQVRRAKVKTMYSVLERPVSKIAVLDVGLRKESKVSST